MGKDVEKLGLYGEGEYGILVVQRTGAKRKIRYGMAWSGAEGDSMKKNGWLRIVSVMLVMAMCLGACGKAEGEEQEGETVQGSVSQSAAQDIDSTAEAAETVKESTADGKTEASEESSADGEAKASEEQVKVSALPGVTGASGVVYVNDSVFSTLDLTNMSATELSVYMGNGINLGNTFEATTSGKNSSVKVYETAWGQPETTQRMIEGYKAAGFDTLRIPVAWTNTMDFENGDFEINRDYLERVGKIVQYAIDAEMFVIVNDHWDRGWWSAFGSNKPEDVELAWKVYTEIWTQVATYFKDYSQLLILESANEELGNNLNNNSTWPSSGYLTTEQKYETTNAINRKFVDLVRSTGGKNTDRFLLIAGYNTNIDDTLNSMFRMPADTAKDKLFVSVHYYDPANYCLAGDSGNLSKWGIKSEYEHMDKKLASLEKFTKAGYGVIIGESGALATWQNNTPIAQPNTCEWESYFMDNCAIYNYVGCFWDTNGTYHKAAAKIREPEVAEVFAMRSYAQEAAYGDGYLDMVKARMAAQYEAAPVMWEGVETYEAGTPVAWIMWNGGAGTYSVGDVFNPADNTNGITAHNVVIDGAGEYEVSLDFEGGNSGLTFAALAVADGELLYPNSVIIIEEISYDGKPVELISTPYTTSDDGKCTRVNLINEWVTQRPKEARAIGNLAKATATILDKTQIVGIHNITIKFRFVVR